MGQATGPLCFALRIVVPCMIQPQPLIFLMLIIKSMFYEKIEHHHCFILICVFVFSQNTITGTFPGLANQQIKLVGFDGFDTYSIDNVQANEKEHLTCHTAKMTLAWAIFYQRTGKALL